MNRSFTRTISFLVLLPCLLLLPGAKAPGAPQQGLITIRMTNSSVDAVLLEMQKKSAISFAYNVADLKEMGRISVDETDKSVEYILDKIFRNSPFTYRLADNKVTVTKAAPAQQQQQTTITGIVVDKAGAPISNVSVIIAGTKSGTKTDARGRFSIAIRRGQALQFLFTGLKTQEIRPEGRTTLRVVMEAQSQQVDEVVVTGLYTADRKTYTGAAKTVTSEELKQISPTNIFQALQAVDPSFVVQENNAMGSDPSAMPEIQIRGVSSLPDLEAEYKYGQNQPAFMLDGFEVTIETVFDLDPNRIESITILKDAAATAIYGSKAANGVVVIVTKAPETGKMNVYYNGNFQLTLPDLSSYNLCNSWEKLEVERLTGKFADGYLDLDYNEKYQNILRGYNTDWTVQPIRRGLAQQHSVSLSGGDEFVRYSLNVGMNPNTGVMKGSGRERYSADFTLNGRFGKLSLKNKMAYEYAKAENSPYGAYTEYTRLDPYYKMRDDRGDYLFVLDRWSSGFSTSRIYNPLWNSTLTIIDENYYGRFSNVFNLDWTLFPGLRVLGQIGIAFKMAQTDRFLPAQHTSFYPSSSGGLVIDPDAVAKEERRGSYTITNATDRDLDGNFGISYNRFFGSHSINFNSKATISQAQTKTSGFKAEGFPSHKLNDPSLARQYAQNGIPTGQNTIRRNAGVFAALNYAFKGRYFTDLNYRTDASSVFGSKNRWAPFWTTGVGWNVHQESFMEFAKPALNILKMRASYGMVGGTSFNPNQSEIINRYLSERYNSAYGVAMSGLGNEYLKWQVSYKFNVGIDLNAFDNRFYLQFDYYTHNIRNQLADITIPTSLGFSTYKENLGEGRTNGFDFTLRGQLIKRKDFMLTLTVNGAASSNKLTKISNAMREFNARQDASTSNTTVTRLIEGTSLNTLWVVRSLGIDPATGNELFLDLNGEETFSWSTRNYVHFATTDPDLRGTIGMNLYYKGFSFNTSLQYSFGSYLYNQTLVNKVENANTRYNVDRRIFYDRWKEPGQKTFFKRINDTGNTYPTSRFCQLNNYLHMTSINVGYDFKTPWMESIGLRSLKISAYINDIFRFSTIRTERGTDYPYARTLSFSVNARF